MRRIARARAVHPNLSNHGSNTGLFLPHGVKLKPPLGHLNAKTVRRLRRIINDASAKVPGLESLTRCLDEFEQLILDFIELRNGEKE